MAIKRLNHAVLYVRDAERSTAFYTDVLDFRVTNALPGATFLQAPGSTNDHDLGLFGIGDTAGPSRAGRTTVGLYHLAWEVDTLDELSRIADVLTRHGALFGATDHGTTKALYARDPDGIEFEVSWLVPADLVDDETRTASASNRPLDLDRERRRYGGATEGGVGVSHPGVARASTAG